MNETTQTQINMGDYNKPQEQTRAIGIGKISGETLNIKAFKTNRGKPSPYTPKDAIGEDGLTDYNVIDTVETFDVNGQQVRSFFVTPAIVKQIQRVPNYQSELAAGNVFGPCKVGQKCLQRPVQTIGVFFSLEKKATRIFFTSNCIMISTG